MVEDGKEQECPSSNFPAVPSHWLRIDKGEDGQLNGKVDAKWQQLRLSANDSLQRVLSKGALPKRFPLFILASSVCWSLQCLISTLTQGGGGGHFF